MLSRSPRELFIIKITLRMICYRDHLKNNMLTRSPGEWYYIFTWTMACYQEVWYFIEITWRMVCFRDHL